MSSLPLCYLDLSSRCNGTPWLASSPQRSRPALHLYPENPTLDNFYWPLGRAVNAHSCRGCFLPWPGDRTRGLLQSPGFPSLPPVTLLPEACIFLCLPRGSRPKCLAPRRGHTSVPGERVKGRVKWHLQGMGGWAGGTHLQQHWVKGCSSPDPIMKESLHS